MGVSKNAEDIALARCQLLGPLLQSEMDCAKRAQEVRRIAEQHHLSERTIRRWLSRYAQEGFRGLMTQPKPAHNRSSSVTEEIVDTAVILRREVPTRSVADLIRILELEGRITRGQVKRSTLQDHLEKRGYGARQIAMYNTGSAGASRRFERSGRNELWQADYPEYGWRSSDIVNFQFSQIDWDKNIIRFSQHKTNIPLEYPLLSTVGNVAFRHLPNNIFFLLLFVHVLPSAFCFALF